MSDEGHGGLEGIEEALESAYDEWEGDTLEQLRRGYELAKVAVVGSTVLCPVCHRAFKKVVKAQVFDRSKGPRNCKDRYWNAVNDDRRERAIIMQR